MSIITGIQTAKLLTHDLVKFPKKHCIVIKKCLITYELFLYRLYVILDM